MGLEKAALTRARRWAMRADLLARCWDAEGLPPGLFSHGLLFDLGCLLEAPGRLLVGAVYPASLMTSSILEAAIAEVVRAAVVAAATSAVRNFIVLLFFPIAIQILWLPSTLNYSISA